MNGILNIEVAKQRSIGVPTTKSLVLGFPNCVTCTTGGTEGHFRWYATVFNEASLKQIKKNSIFINFLRYKNQFSFQYT